MMSRKLSTREKVLLVILAVLLVFSGYYLLVHQPVSEAIAAADAAREDAETQIMVEAAKAAKLREMREALEGLELDPESGAAEIPDYDNMQNVVRTLNAALSAADSYNLIFGAVTFEEHIASRPIDMTFTCGSYAAARDIVAGLYASPYRCAITALALTAAREDGGAAQLARDAVSVKLTITYYEYAA